MRINALELLKTLNKYSDKELKTLDVVIKIIEDNKDEEILFISGGALGID